MQYEEFINQKRIIADASGFDISQDALNPMLYDYQKDIALWSLRKGKSALFLDCGLGKSFIEAEFAHAVYHHTDVPVLVVAPLGVSAQLKSEFAKLGREAAIIKEPYQITGGINITNYERVTKFDPSLFGGIVLDESSILKGRFGVTRQELTDFASSIPYRLCGTATPAPNDLEELIYHAVFLGVMTEGEIKALYFTQDGNNSNKFRLKRHAVEDFWRFVSSWAVAMRKPSDLGYSDEGFELPALNIHEVKIDVAPDAIQQGTLFTMEAQGINEQRQARKATLPSRIEAAKDLVNQNPDEQWVVWCKYNAESEGATSTIDGAIEVTGSDKPDDKETRLLGFSNGDIDVLITKAQIAGFGMNWQNCNKTILLGWDNSFEQFYQLTRRFWRHGQQRDVDVYVITTDADGSISENMRRKEAQASLMYDEIIRNMSIHTDLTATTRDEMEYTPAQDIVMPSWLKSCQSAVKATISAIDDFRQYMIDSGAVHVNGELEAYRIESQASTNIELPVWL